MAGKYNFEVLTFRKQDVFAQLTALQTKSSVDNLTPGDAEVILEEAQDRVNTNDFPAFDDLILATNKHCVLINEAKATRTNTASLIQTNPNIAIEKLSLTHWNGKIEGWNAWYSLFSSAVENNTSLSPIQKFLYLRKYLSDEPLAIVRSFEVNDNNFFEAMKLLKARYQNERRLGSFYLNKIMHYQKGSDKSFSTFLNIHRTAAVAMRSLSKIRDLSDFILFCISYSNLDFKMQNLFDMSRDATQIPRLDELFQFIQQAATNEELKLDCQNENKSVLSDKNKFRKNSKPFVAVTEKQTRPHMNTNNNKQFDLTCPQCSGKHKLYLCEHFKNIEPQNRQLLVKQWKRCTNCLSGTHQSNCYSKYRCSVCKQDHHTLLHSDIHKAVPTPVVTESQALTSAMVGCAASGVQVLLGTISCEAENYLGDFVPVRCLLDSGAQVSLATSTIAKKLGLAPKTSRTTIKGISSISIPAMGSMNLKLRSLHEKEVKLGVKVTLVKRVCSELPTYDICQKVKNKFDTLKLADEDFDKPASIDIILGSDVIFDILSTREPCVIKDIDTGLCAQNTIFGYILQGKLTELSDQDSPTVLFTSSLEQNMEKFWQIEEVAIHRAKDPEDEYCEKLFNTTTRRLPDGSFSVKLPFKIGARPDLLTNRNSALMSYKNLEKRISKNHDLALKYNSQMIEYIKLGHMTLHSEVPASYIMPQLLVSRDDSKTTKLRTVFNASSMAEDSLTKDKKTFNDLLLTGPKLQSDLSDLLLRFRLNEVALTADVKMMFRMIKVEPEDRRYQHIFFRETPEAEIEEYEINVLLFGEKSSPYLAQRVVKQLIVEDGHSFPEAAQALGRNLYVDDYVDSVATVEEAKRRKAEVSELMKRGGFALRKWTSSHPQVLENMSSEDMEKIEFTDENCTVKILGLQWEPKEDCFGFQVANFEGPITKRSCLSYIARTFDCLGLVCPVIFWMKSFLQKLWLEKLSWDYPLPTMLTNQWKEFTMSMEALKTLKILRCVKNGRTKSVHLAGFSDGSQLGYAACIYLVARYENGNVSSHLLKAKSKLSPLKTISVPRLELCGFLLLSQLCANVLAAMTDMKLDSVHLFTDSEIVLAWIRTPPHLLKTFVANRITKILELTPGMLVSHVRSEFNPSDCATRGLAPQQIPSHPLWWAGPPFLQDDPANWGRDDTKKPIEIPEMKPIQIVQLVNEEDENSIYFTLVKRFSSLPKLQRVMAYVLRFTYNCTTKDKNTGPLTVRELDKALLKCVFVGQQYDFAEELQAMSKKNPTHRLRKLSPFLDSENLLRVGGRLVNSSLPDAAKHPLLLSKENHLSRLIGEYHHRILLHAGPRTTRAVIQRKFWILSAHSLLRRLIHQCKDCLRWQAKPLQPYMGNLPSSRVQVSRCFAFTCLDMAGPFTTKETIRRKSPTHKSYFCIFVCEATKAVHLEAVSDLTTASFLACFDRFVARRSLPVELRSDNGRNFVGARRELKECQRFLEENAEKIYSELRSRQVTWKLNPSYASHFGGLFEAAVKSAKNLIYRQVGNTILTFEELSTLLTRIEAVLNSRPIGFTPVDPNDGTDYLSPAHFLVGGLLVSTPETPMDQDIHPTTRWNRVRQLAQQFWHRWKNEYLHSLMQREKWTRQVKNVSVGQLVYITSEQTSPLAWPIGRITAVYPGADYVVRVVDVKTASGTYRRPVNKLVVIPTTNE